MSELFEQKLPQGLSRKVWRTVYSLIREVPYTGTLKNVVRSLGSSHYAQIVLQSGMVVKADGGSVEDCQQYLFQDLVTKYRDLSRKERRVGQHPEKMEYNERKDLLQLREIISEKRKKKNLGLLKYFVAPIDPLKF